MLSNRNSKDMDRWNRYQALKTRYNNMGENGLIEREREELAALQAEFEKPEDDAKTKLRKGGFRKAVELLGYED